MNLYTEANAIALEAWQESDGAIACRIAYATLYCAAIEALHEIAEEAQE